MGANPSAETVATVAPGGQFPHVLQVTPQSPGDVAGLISFFDFILSANGQPLDREDGRMVTIFRENIGKPVKLEVYNIRSESRRELFLVPSVSWGGPGLAGISIRYTNIGKAIEHVWHVLKIHTRGPAALAGLEAYTDFIVGNPESVFSDSEELYNKVKNNLEKPVQLYIYSTKTDRVRLVSVTPSRNWGGEGYLGCDIAYGFLHQIPSKAPQNPGGEKSLLPDRSSSTSPTSEASASAQPSVAQSTVEPVPLISTLHAEEQSHPAERTAPVNSQSNEAALATPIVALNPSLPLPVTTNVTTNFFLNLGASEYLE